MFHSIKFKQFTRPLCVLICFFVLFSCEENTAELSPFADVPIMPQEELRATFSETFKEARLNGNNYIIKSDQEVVINLSTMKSMRAFLPKSSQFQLVRNTNDNPSGRMQSDINVESRITETQFSDEFKEFSIEVLQFSENLEFMSFEEGIEALKEIEQDVEISTLDEFERIAIYEVLNVSRIILEESYSNYREASENGRVECETNWREVAKASLQAGLTGGAATGLTWAKAGAIATTAGGQPWVGVIVGGLAGFTTGFIYGGLLGGAANYLSQKAFPDCDNSGKAKFAVDFVCLDPLCNERVPIGGVGIKGAKGGTIYFVGG